MSALFVDAQFWRERFHPGEKAPGRQRQRWREDPERLQRLSSTMEKGTPDPLMRRIV